MKITQKILVFILVFTALKIGVAYYFEVQNTRQLMLKTVDDHEKLIDARFRNDVRATVGALATSLEILEDDQAIKEAYLSNDRERLYTTAQPLFERIKKNSEITHFYFIRPDGTCFLRVHDKDTFDMLTGDYVTQSVNGVNKQVKKTSDTQYYVPYRYKLREWWAPDEPTWWKAPFNEKMIHRSSGHRVYLPLDPFPFLLEQGVGQGKQGKPI